MSLNVLPRDVGALADSVLPIPKSDNSDRQQCLGDAPLTMFTWECESTGGRNNENGVKAKGRLSML